MRLLSIICIPFILAGCLPEEESSYGFELEFPESNFDEDGVVGRTFGTSGVKVGTEFISDPDNPRVIRTAENVEVSFTLNSRSSGTLVLEGTEYELNSIFGETGYRSPADNLDLTIGTKLADGPRTADVLYYIIAGGTFGDVIFFVDGDETRASRLPSGNVRYAGAAIGATSTSARPVVGTAEMDVAFADNSFELTLDGVNPRNTAESYTFDSGQTFNGDLTAVSTDPNAFVGALDGNIYGRNGNQAAGTFSISTPDDQPFVGMFSMRSD